jgi:two-component system sensor histidine kinase KdpD
MLICTLLMLTVRPHLSVATAALVLVIPVVVGVAAGGFLAGSVAAAVGFLVYDWFFIPPYGTLTVGAAQNWAAAFVYVVVVLIVARIVAFQQQARDVARQREDEIRRLFVVSQNLIGQRPLNEVLELVVTTVHETFPTRWVALLLPADGMLRIAATAGAALSDADRVAAVGEQGSPQSLALMSAHSDISRVALSTTEGPVGQLVVAGATLVSYDRELLGTFANQAALAIERSQLLGQALRTELLEEVDRWRSALMGAVSHDLRTPLASMKSAVSTLRSDDVALSEEDTSALLEMIEDQSDHLARLVANLLDMARLDAGTLTLNREPHAVGELVDAALQSLGTALAHHLLAVRLAPDLPLVDVDLVLLAQVLANLLSNAVQHSPEGSTITVGAVERGATVAISVADEGPGVPVEDREGIFQMVDRRAGSGRAGLGLAISTAFVEAHDQRLTVEDAPGGGAKFTFTVPVAEIEDDVA